MQDIILVYIDKMFTLFTFEWFQFIFLIPLVFAIFYMLIDFLKGLFIK